MNVALAYCKGYTAENAQVERTRRIGEKERIAEVKEVFLNERRTIFAEFLERDFTKIF